VLKSFCINFNHVGLLHEIPERHPFNAELTKRLPLSDLHADHQMSSSLNKAAFIGQIYSYQSSNTARDSSAI